MNVQILIIDDNIKLKDSALIWELRDTFGENNVIFISKPEDGLNYVAENLEKNIIILLDIQFPSNENMDGHRLLAEIYKISQLIPVILWSGVNEDKETFSDFINNNAFGFVSKDATIKEIFNIINKAISHLNTSLDNTIEDWIINKHEDKDRPVYFTADGKSYSLNNILFEIRNQTKIGRSFSQKLNALTIDLLIRNKQKIND